jgi:hypothetical protein
MFIETRRPHVPHKLRRSGMRKIGEQRKTEIGIVGHSRTCRSYGAWNCFRSQRAINMALLTELLQMDRLEPLIALNLRCCRDGRLSVSHS